MRLDIHPKFIKIARGKNIVILTEDEYERILDALDCIEAAQVLADKNDPVLKWEDVHGKLIGNRIAQARKDRGVTRDELARRLKVTPERIGRMERKASRPPFDAIKNIARALNCSVDDLI